MLGSFAIDGIEYIESFESRVLVEHRVPGLAGNYFQDMGTVPNTIVISGTKNGDEARDNFLTGIREIFNKGEPTTFVADINTATDITDVVIEDLDVTEIGGNPDSFRYLVKLRKYVKPPEPPQTSLLDTDILGDALNIVDALDVLDALGSIPNLGDPTEPVRGALDMVKAATGGLDQAVNDLRDLFSGAATESPATVPEAVGPSESVASAEELRIDPADPRIDRATGSVLQNMLETPEKAETARRLARGVQDGTLAGILGDDSDAAKQLAGAHGTEPLLLVPPGQDAALVLDAASPLEAPPTIIFRTAASDLRDDPARLGAALEAVGRTFEFFQRGELGPCDSSPSAIPVANLVPSTFCHVPVVVPDIPVGERLEGEPEEIDPSAPDLRIDPADPRIDVGAKFALQRMLKVPEMAVDAARLIRAINGETLAGIFGDDLGVAVQVAHAHGTERWLLVPKGEDAAVVLDAAVPLEAPPTVIFRGDTPNIRDIPARIDPALQKASRTFELWQRRQLGPCVDSASAIPVPNLVPPSFCRLPGTDLVVLVTKTGTEPGLPGPVISGARVQVEGLSTTSELTTRFTDETGQARFPDLAHGSYRVTAGKEGFKDAGTEVVHPGDQVQPASFLGAPSAAPLLGVPILLQLAQSKLFKFKVKNRLFDEVVPDVRVVVFLKGEIVGLTGVTDSKGEVEIGLSDSEYELSIRPKHRLAGPVGPGVGQAGGSGPDRIWREMEAEITVKDEKVEKVKGENITTDGDTVTIKLQPVWMRSPNRSSRPSDESATISLIVLHGTGTKSIKSAINTFMTNGEISAHYVIDLDGQVVKMVHEEDQAHHAGESQWFLNDSVNEFSVGIEIVHENGSGKLYTQAQYDELLDKPGLVEGTIDPGLLNRIRAEHIEIGAEKIVGHSDIATVSPPEVTARRLARKATDPGVEFDWSKLAIEGFGPNVKHIVDVASMYGGLFDTSPNSRLQMGDNDAGHRYGNVVRPSLSGIIAEMQKDLGAIGYFGSFNGTYDEVTFWTVAMFQDHVFSAGSPHPDGADGSPQFERGQVDKLTAIRIKEIRP
jgi:N-acetyl-anhydromuramyl-L-alanine amidase AmpD